MAPLERLQLVAARQFWVLSLEDLHDAGLGTEAIRHAVASHRLFRRYPGVYVYGRRALSETGGYLAAVLAAGDGALLSHLAAARLWGVWERTIALVDVSVASQNGRSGPKGIRLHRAGSLAATDGTVRRGVPVTSLRRTLIDCAGVLPPRGLRSVLRRAEQDHGLDLDALYRSIQGPRTVARYARLRRALEQWVPKSDLTESDLELEFLAFCRRYRIPLPEPQRRFGPRYRPDFVWEELKLVVETDGDRFHRGSIQQTADAAKDRALRAYGYEVVRFTWAEIVNTPAVVAKELRAIIVRRRHELAAIRPS